MEHITRADGLLDNRIEDITQDSAGFLWVASSTGISRYNGTSFRHYYYEDMVNPEFPASSVMRLFTDNQGGIWTSNNAGAMLSYDPVKDRFEIRNDSLTRLPAIGISYYQDTLGNFWIGTLNEGLCFWDRADGRLTTYRRAEHPDSISDNLITDINPGFEPGILTISTTRGNNLFSMSERKFYRRWYDSENPDDTYKHNVVRDFLETDDAYYAGAFGGLHVTQKSDFRTRHFFPGRSPGSTLNYSSVWEMAEDASGKIWIATYGGGINIYDPSTISFTYLTKNNSGLSEDNLRGIFKDRDGILWIITDNTGLIKIDPRKDWIRHIGFEELGIDGIMGALSQADSIVWLGANGGGLLRYDLRKETIQRYSHNPADRSSIGYDHISSISSDPSGNLWIGLAGGGLDYFDVRKQEFTHFLYDSQKSSIPENAISDVLWTDSVIWYGTYSTGFGTYDPDSRVFTNYPFPNENYDIKTEVRDIFRDNLGNIWILTARGVIIFDKNRGELIDLISANKPEMPVKMFNFSDIAEYSPGKIALLNNNDELVLVEYKSPREVSFMPYDIPAELRQNFHFREILSVNDSMFWLVHDKGLARLGKEGRRSIFTNIDGLIGQEFYLLNKQGDGLPLVSSNIGLNVIDLAEYFRPKEGPTVILESLSILNRPVTIDAADSIHGMKLEKNLDLIHSLELDYGHKEFSIGFSALQFYAPGAVRYRYRLMGFSEDWIGEVEETWVSYTNLDPGSYTFEVQASVVPDVWGPVKQLDIQIRPPFWQTWWFIGIVILLTAGLLYFLHYYRLQKALAVANLRNQIAQDLHDDIGSSLTKISLYGSLLSEEGEKTTGSGILNSIGELSREVIGQMSDIVWSVDQKNDTAGNLIARMRQFAADTLEACGIELEFEVSNIREDNPVDPLFRQNFYLIFKEAVHNICKHSRASHVTVKIAQVNGRYTLLVNDDGRGMSLIEHKVQNNGIGAGGNGNGLTNMRRRAERIQMKFSIRSEAGSGTKITLE